MRTARLALFVAAALLPPVVIGPACLMPTRPGAVPPCQDFSDCPAGGPTSLCVLPGSHSFPQFAGKAIADLLSRF